MGKFSFYFKYAWRSVLRGGQRSLFAVICVAIGVAALVSMQSLAASIQETLLGDINSLTGGSVIARGVRTADGRDVLNTVLPAQQETLDKLKTEGQIQDWTSISSNSMQISGYFGFPPSLFTVDPAHFPLYGTIDMVEPAKGNFSSLLAQPNAIIVSKYLWDKNSYKLGQEIDIASSGGFGLSSTSGKSARLKVVGEIRTGAPGIPFDQGFIFGFGVISQQTAANLFPSPTASNNNPLFYLKAAPSTNNDKLALTLENSPAGFQSVQTAAQVQKQIGDVLQYVDLLLSIVGLLGILIGGVGVINTMLVVIGRRTTEIATVKALGLKTRQTLTIFTIEAMMLGAIGSVVGVLLGTGLGFGIKGVAEGIFLRPLNWGFYPGPILIGLLVGLISSGVFGFLPSYAAGRVRPGVVLRQQSSSLPRVGGGMTFVIIAFMTLAMGLIAGVLVKDLLTGIIGAFVTLIILALITLGLYMAVWVVGKIPFSIGPSSKMALRSFSRHRGRTATTLLVMVVGLFFITFIVIIADSIKEPVRRAFDTNLGFNVLAVNLTGSQTEQIQARLQTEVPGLQKVFAGNNTNGEINSINGKPPGRGGFINLSGRTLANGESLSPNGGQKLVAGRNFTPADTDQKVVLVNQTEAALYGVKVGDRVNLSLQSNGFNPTGRPGSPNNTNTTTGGGQDFQVIGIVVNNNSTFQFERGWVVPYRVVAGAGSGNNFGFFYMLIDRNQIKPALTKVQSMIAGGFVFDLGDLIDTFTRLLDQFLAFPLLLSLLSLFSGAILIANNVALAMLERRTEIGVLKAIGAKRRRVLNMLMWESGLVGFLGGLIGIGVGIIIALLIPVLSAATNRGGANNNFAITWSPLTALLLLALGIGLAIAATLISAWGAIQEKPLVVLRYE